jgi:hypothetical protein
VYTWLDPQWKRYSYGSSVVPLWTHPCAWREISLHCLVFGGRICAGCQNCPATSGVGGRPRHQLQQLRDSWHGGDGREANCRDFRIWRSSLLLVSSFTISYRDATRRVSWRVTMTADSCNQTTAALVPSLWGCWQQRGNCSLCAPMDFKFVIFTLVLVFFSLFSSILTVSTCFLVSSLLIYKNSQLCVVFSFIVSLAFHIIVP